MAIKQDAIITQNINIRSNDLAQKKNVFCLQNCSDLLWEKIVVEIEKNFWNLRLFKGTIYSNSEKSSQNKFWNRILFNLFLEVSQI